MVRPLPHMRNQYRYFRPIDLRWNDVDRFGHVNNAVFFELFDTTVNLWLADVGLFQNDHDPMCVVARHACDYFFEIKQSDNVEVALAIEAIGRSSRCFVSEKIDPLLKAHMCMLQLIEWRGAQHRLGPRQ
jgi:acyl-CoA thioester hydrolase